MTSPATEEELLALLSQFAETSFEEQGQVPPLFHAITEDGEHLLYMTPWEDGKAKAKMLKMVRAEFARKHVVRYGYVSEVWLAGYDAPPRVLPSERPDRKEAVVVAIVAPPRVTLARRDIVRPWDGTKAYLGPLVFHEMEHATGATLGLLS